MVSERSDLPNYCDLTTTPGPPWTEAYLMRLFDEHRCPKCGQEYRGSQVGRCVYCEHCGFRLYQGRKRP